MTLNLPPSGGAEHAAWHLLMDLASHDMPRWALVGGLMVQVHLHHAGLEPRRATTDVDILIDVQIIANATQRAARTLRDQLGLDPQGRPSIDGGQVLHRVVRAADKAAVDLLAPDHFRGPHLTIPPARTIETPGGRYLLNHVEDMTITYDSRSAQVLLPSIGSAIVGKWRAYSEIATQVAPDRHLQDAADLLEAIDPDSWNPNTRERGHLRRLQATFKAQPQIARDADLVLDTLSVLLHSGT